VVGGTASSPTFTGTIVNVPNPTDITSLTGEQVDAMVNTFFSSTAPFSVSFDIVGANTVGGRSLRFYGTADSPACPPPPPFVAGATTDPHLHFAHGGRADFKGEHNTWYNMLSAKNTSVNVHFQHDVFHNLHKLVHGSKMAKLAMTLRTSTTGQIVTVSFNASATGTTQAVINTPAGEERLSHKSGTFELENIQMIMREKKLGSLGSHGMALTVTDGRWEVQAWSKPFPNAAANPGKALLNVEINAKYDADHDVVAPHGIIGQSYDGDGLAVDGAVDDYSVTEVTTKAMAEGAIEGEASDYKMAGPFATEYRYSRFDATEAKPRDASVLTGVKKESKKQLGFGSAGAVEDQ
jgi:hypothetical protein